MPAVSIVLPAFNRVRFLRPAIESVLAQTVRDWELLIADDGSAEETKAYLRSLSDYRIKVLWLDHGGNPARARNAALNSAGGTYIAFLDSDDLWIPEKLEIQLAAHEREGSPRWSYSAYRCIDASGREAAPPGGKPWAPYAGAIFERILRFEADIVTATVIAERSLLLSVGGFDEGQAVQEDYDLWMRLAAVGEVAVIERPLVAMRLHDEHYGKGGLQARLSRHRSLRKLRQGAAGPRYGAALDEAIAENSLKLALAYAGSDRRAAIKTLRSEWHLIAVRRPWAALVRIGVKSAIPRWALALRYRRSPRR